VVVAAVCTSFNEADIIGTTCRHLLANGVDHIYLADASTDDTRERAKEVCDGSLTILEDDESYHFQPLWINRMAAQAAQDGHDWILPFDADEFVYATDGGTIRKSLLALPDDVRVLHVRAYQHRDWDHRERDYRSMGKVAFRWEPGAWVANGNHSVSLPYPAHEGVLDLRELQFRSFEHLARKCHERVDRLDPTLPYTEGTHQRVLAALSDEELRVEWAQLQAVPVVFDPVPIRS
jgi:Glycosyl transferase family 2